MKALRYGMLAIVVAFCPASEVQSAQKKDRPAAPRVPREKKFNAAQAHNSILALSATFRKYLIPNAPLVVRDRLLTAEWTAHRLMIVQHTLDPCFPFLPPIDSSSSQGQA
jgi:hypothetical protein